MLKELTIKNLAIIKEVHLDFTEKFTVLTGETGAGKSIILNGLNIILGEKISSDLIRKDAELLMAEGVFDINPEISVFINEFGIEIEEDEELIVKRQLDINGKGKAFINGQRVSIKNLRAIMNNVVDLIGQHSHQILLDSKKHIEIIDNYLDEKGIKTKEKIVELFNSLKENKKKLRELEENKKDFKEKNEFYKFQVEEIEKIDPKVDEDEELEKEYKKLFNAGKIKEKLEESIFLSKNSDMSLLSSASKIEQNLGALKTINEEYEEIFAKVEKLYYDIEDVVYSIENLLDETEIDDSQLSIVSNRLDELKKLKLKYGSSNKEIIDYKNNLKEKVNTFYESDKLIEEINKEIEIISNEYTKSAEILSDIRKSISKEVENEIIDELNSLNMKGTEFKVDIEKKENFDINGLDSLEFKIATNIGEDLKSLQKIVSGGEISRIMLSLKTVFAKVDNIPVLIFDEIDTGIGGETIKKVAEKLKKISFGSQVICITHSPHIAAKAKQQYFIKKEIKNNKTTTKVNKLKHEDRIVEITRMLGGQNSTETVIKHAKELLKEG